MKLEKLQRNCPFLAIGLVASLISPVASAFEIETHRAISEVALRDRGDCVVNNYLHNQLDVGQGIAWVVSGQSLLSWASFGAEEEDAILTLEPLQFLRFLNHFYNPLTKAGLRDDILFSKGCWDSLPTIRANGILATDSLNWGWRNQGAWINADFSWQAARQAYADWLLAAHGPGYTDDAAQTFRCLGHVIHLLQDAGQPQHTRDDAHGPADGFFVCGDGAPFEVYCQRRFGTAADIKSKVAAWAAEPIPVFTQLPPAKGEKAAPPEFAAFWDTGQFGRATDAAKGFSHPLGIGEFSHAYFVTADTLFTGEPVSPNAVPLGPYVFGAQIFRDSVCGRSYEFLDFGGYSPLHTLPYPRLRDLVDLCSFVTAQGHPIAFVEVRRDGEVLEANGYQQLEYAGVPAGTFGAKRITNYCSARFEDATNSLPDRLICSLVLADTNREAHAQMLLPKTIAYSTGLLNYFFRGKLAANLLIPDCSTQTQALVEIANLSTWQGQGETFRDGQFYILRDEGEGTLRQLSAVLAQGIGYPGSLPSGATLSANLPNLQRGTRNFVVFIGTIGSEKSIAVAAVKAQVRKRSEVYPPNPALLTSVIWLAGQRVGTSVQATAQLLDANGFPLAERELRFSVSLNSRGGPTVPNQQTDCEGKVTINYSILLDNGDPAAGSRVTAYFDAPTGSGYISSHMRSPVY